MADYRDPKVTTTEKSRRGSGAGRWIGILIAIVIVAVLIAWWWGGFGYYDEVVVVPEAAVEGEVAPVAPVQQ